MFRKLLFLVFILFTFQTIAQNDAGKLVYRMKVNGPQDTLIAESDSARFTTIFFLGDLTRTETYSPNLGKQVLIKNLKTNKGTLLLNLGEQKLAIEIDYNKDTSATKNPYTIKNKCKSKEIVGKKVKLAKVNRYNKELDLYYLKGADAKYCPTYNDAKGLPLEYRLVTGEIEEIYTCTELKFYAISNSFFDVPEGYLKLTMEQFLQGIQQQ